MIYIYDARKQLLCPQQNLPQMIALESNMVFRTKHQASLVKTI